jgi:hypothetical protein
MARFNWSGPSREYSGRKFLTPAHRTFRLKSSGDPTARSTIGFAQTILGQPLVGSGRPSCERKCPLIRLFTPKPPVRFRPTSVSDHAPTNSAMGRQLPAAIRAPMSDLCHMSIGSSPSAPGQKRTSFYAAKVRVGFGIGSPRSFGPGRPDGCGGAIQPVKTSVQRY